MIPRTFPSTIDANGNRSMVIFPITTYEPSGRWRDWIPVRGGTNSAKVNTYDEDGGQSMTIIDTLTNKQAWLDYVPVVFVGGNDVDAWDVKDIGFIPGFGDVPALSLNFSTLEFDKTNLSFTRSGDRSATVIDNEGIIWACKANEMRMQGFRRVENILPDSEGYAGWLLPNTTHSYTDFNSRGRTSLLRANVANYAARIQLTVTAAINTPLCFSVVAKLGTAGGVGIGWSDGGGGSVVHGKFDLRTGTLGGTGGTVSSYGMSPVGDGYYLCWVIANTPIANPRVFISPWEPGTPDAFNYPTNATVGVNVSVGGSQLEIAVPGLTRPSEYVSIAQLTTPFHGFFADGVKYFTTDRNGDDIPEATRGGLLIEESGDNKLLQSETFGTTWATGGTAVITSDNHASPAGIQNADRYVPNVGVAGILQQTVSITIGTFTFSCYVKRTGTTLNSIRLQTTEGANFAFADFNLSTLVVNTGASGMTGVSGVVSSADSNGWHRCTLHFTSITAAATNFLFTLPTSSGNGVDGFYMWGAQLENRPFNLSYVPTTTASVLRPADICVFNPITGFFTASQPGSMFAEAVLTVQPTVPNAILAFNDNTSSNRIDIRATQGAQSQSFHSNGGVNQATPAIPTAPLKGANTKYGLAWATNDVSFVRNGGTPVPDNSATYPASAIDRFYIGSIDTAGNQFNGYFKKVLYFRKRMSDAHLIALTA